MGYNQNAHSQEEKTYQVRIVKFQLSREQRDRLERVPEGRIQVQLETGNVDDEEKKASSFDVLQEPVTHADVVAGAFD